jgi:hypothetical protein
MTNPEFKTGFDILYNNVTSNQAPGLNEVEMSFFLNTAQEEVLKNHLNPKGNKYSEGYDDSTKRQIEFATVTRSTSFTEDFFIDFDGIFAILNETVTVVRDQKEILLTVVPLSFKEWDKAKASPYPYPLKKQAWRLINNGGINLVVGPHDVIKDYTIRYIANPSKIDLTDDNATCNLPAILHKEILHRAVELAKLSWEGSLNSIVAAGQNSE